MEVIGSLTIRTLPTALLVALKLSEKVRVTVLPGSRDAFPGTLLVLALPGFPRRGILAEPLRTWRSSSVARLQCRSLPPGASPGLHSDRVPKINAAGQQIQPIAVRERHVPPGTAEVTSNELRP
ncbi:hypothetical protein NDU88_003389 [Pleurodeles waltl]|uniref:Uncharacterized protein n=1 Tax=Pleurodeles waltl TaxID=8319 RepID=A0AAV7NGA1_PLEWA|nr:hypothetical protein NDU88_003389 [Pleurodeles waltl]